MKISKYFKFLAFLFLLAIGAGTGGECWAVVLFETNFDSGSNWTHQQTKNDQTCLSNCGISNGFQAYRDGMSYCSSVRNNNFYMNAGAGYPGTASSCKSGSKCLTFWTERCVDYFEDSDGNLGVWFPQEQGEVYAAFWIKYQPSYDFGTDEGAQEKLFHLQYSTSGQNPWSYFSGTLYNSPVVVGGVHRYATSVDYYTSPRCTGWDDVNDSMRCSVGTPYYCPTYGNCDMEQWIAGTVATVMRDGLWHHLEWRFKMNTGNTGNFNADGILQFWYDGVLRQTFSAIPWNKNEAGYSPRGWKFFSIGGNNLIKPTSSGSYEQWWAVDDLVLSTTYVGPNYVVGGGPPPDTMAPTVPGGLTVR